ncbi:MAG: PH domain-containing protein [Proteobacteria bacterium]|nr:PH domain-containing protein [Pseudomonadota bacterium]MDA1063856.1 PH domain-containing protein [Pseudomonadota bacterium]
MNTPDSATWQRTSPYAILFFLGRMLRLIVNNAWQSIAPLFAVTVAYQGDLVSKLILGGILAATAILGGAVLSWLFFTYQIRTDSILIRSGVIKKKQLDIKFDRIQGVNTQQNPVYRVLKLVTVTFDTAGSSGSEGNLPAVTREFANSLREKIGRGDAAEMADDDAPAVPSTSLLQLDWRDMIRIALADRRALIIFAFVGPLLEQMGDRFEQFIEKAVESAAFDASKLDVGTGAIIVVMIFFSVVALLLIMSIASAFLRYHNFELLLDGRTLRSTGGLLTHHEHAMDLQKFQTLRLQQGIVQSWLGRFTMTARQAISGRKQRRGTMFMIPVVTADQADQLRKLMLSPAAGRLTQDPRSALFQPVSRYYLRSRILYVGLMPAMLWATAFTAVWGVVGLVALLWLPLVALVSWRSWQRAGYLHDDDELVCRSGLLGFRTVALLFRKVQRVTVTQSRFQRRKNLASLRLYMASGNVRVPYIAHATAQQLRDYILYRVESSQQSWH